MAISRKDIRALLVLAVLGLAMNMAVTWWKDRQDQALGQQIAALAGAGDIRMLSSVTCVFCGRARQWMAQHGVPFSECFIERDTVCAATHQALLLRGTPVLLVRGQAQLGFDPERIGQALAGS